MPLASKHRHGVVEDVASTLDSLIQPACSVSFLVEWDGEGLAPAVIFGVDDRDLELVWMLGKVVGARHALKDLVKRHFDEHFIFEDYLLHQRLRPKLSSWDFHRCPFGLPYSWSGGVGLMKDAWKPLLMLPTMIKCNSSSLQSQAMIGNIYR